MRILAVGAHPDDIELLCAGTLAKYVKRGDHVTLAVACNGECGSPTLPKQEIAAIRRQEAAAAAKVIGADLIWMDYPDGFLFTNETTRLAFLNMVRKARPDVIIGHAPTDYHPDHRTAGDAVWAVRGMTSGPNIKTEYPPYEKIPDILYMDTIAGIDFAPQYYVDISETFELKRQMLECHKSQSIWLENQYGISYVEFMETVARFRGLQCGVRYAECFQSSPTFPQWLGPPLLP